MSVPVNWEKKRARTDSNKAIADRRPNLFWTWAFTYLLSYDIQSWCLNEGTGGTLNQPKV